VSTAPVAVVLNGEAIEEMSDQSRARCLRLLAEARNADATRRPATARALRAAAYRLADVMASEKIDDKPAGLP
jgi:hypothetical protein